MIEIFGSEDGIEMIQEYVKVITDKYIITDLHNGKTIRHEGE